ncbi:hypothetical protein [Litoreibacter halocynthiae]|uniref:hypothetical protein n=1 Tax=Litoreibacter halocynthiae TaxID=1242689 RepID=UPI002490DD43|nr:hypothetical protein [Litoreibacter halocynthiae]
MIRLGLILAVAISGPLLAEDDGGLHADLTIGVGAVIDNDIDLTGMPASAQHGAASVQFLMSSKTRTEKVELRFDGDVIGRVHKRSEAELKYGHKTKSSQFAVNVFGQKHPAGAAYAIGRSLDTSGGFDLAPSQTETRIFGGDIALVSGIGRPIGFDLSYGVRRRKSFGPSATRSTRQFARIETVFRFSELTKARLYLGGEQLRTSGSTAVLQRQRAAGVGVTHKLSKVTEVEADFGWSTVRQFNARPSVTNSGLEWHLKMTRRQRNGSVFAIASSEQTKARRLRRLQFGLVDSALDRSLRLTVGVAKPANTSPDLTMSLEFAVDMASTQIKTLASRNFIASDETGESRIATKLAVGLVRKVGARGTLDVSVGYFKTNRTSVTPERSAGHFRTSYHHALRRDWGVVAGAERRVRREATTGRVGSNSLFVTFEHKFSGGL